MTKDFKIKVSIKNDFEKGDEIPGQFGECDNNMSLLHLDAGMCRLRL